MTHRTAVIALAAKLLKLPIKRVATRDQGFTTATYRADTRHHVKLAADENGKLTAMIHEGEEISSQLDSYKVGGTDMTTRMCDVPYIFALESAVDELAYALDMDPVELRRIKDAQIKRVGGLPYSSRLPNECYAVAAKAFGWNKRNPAPMSTVDGRRSMAAGRSAGAVRRPPIAPASPPVLRGLP